jgi:hypothetical protein
MAKPLNPNSDRDRTVPASPVEQLALDHWTLKFVADPMEVAAGSADDVVDTVVATAEALEKEYREYQAEDSALVYRNVLMVFCVISICFSAAKLSGIGGYICGVCVMIGIVISFSRWRWYTPMLGQIGLTIFSLEETVAIRRMTVGNWTFGVLFCLCVSVTLLTSRAYQAFLICLVTTATVVAGEIIRPSANRLLLLPFFTVAFMLQIIYVNCSYYREKITRRDFWRMKILTLEQQRSEALLSNMLPNSRHAELLMSGGLLYEAIPKATVLQADMVGFTPLSSSISALELYNLLDRLYCKFDAHLDRLGLYKMETIGDAFVVVGGLSQSGAAKTKPAADVIAAIKLAFAMLREVRKIREELDIQFDMRIGKPF